MFKWIESLLRWLDKRAENQIRQTAAIAGRRSALAKLGRFMVGAALLPVLPYDRSMGLAYAADSAMNEDSCDYWRYCAMDGTTCASSGGSLTSCPPGSEASKVSWVGTCRNPKDNQDYLVSYNDCCGKAEVSRATTCFSNKAERPAYRMGVHNDINWCMANENQGYHCTVAILVGMADA